MERLYYIRPDESYRNQALEYIEEHHKYNSHINGCGGLNRYYPDYKAWLEHLEESRNNPIDDNRVPSDTYLLIRESDNRLIGTCNIRYTLNEKLKRIGGHIGYGIRPTERRKGYNKINLYLALLICYENGLNMVYLDCNDYNIASYRTMESLGGKLIRTWNDEKEGLCRRYVIDVIYSLNKYKNEYETKIKR